MKAVLPMAKRLVIILYHFTEAGRQPLDELMLNSAAGGDYQILS